MKEKIKLTFFEKYMTHFLLGGIIILTGFIATFGGKLIRMIEDYFLK